MQSHAQKNVFFFVRGNVLAPTTCRYRRAAACRARRRAALGRPTVAAAASAAVVVVVDVDIFRAGRVIARAAAAEESKSLKSILAMWPSSC